MLKSSLKDLTYRQQLRELRLLAISSLDQFPIKLAKIRFIQHGENTTFKVTDNHKQNYLLRIHRSDYHTKSAIIEELKWLDDLSRQTLIVAPRPIRTISRQLVLKIKIGNFLEQRFVTMFHWVEGRQIKKSISGLHMKKIADLTHKLHEHSLKRNVKFRNYWDVDGLVGKEPFMGPMDSIVGLNNLEQSYLNKAREIVYTQLKKYQKKSQHKMGLIHADLHFGNFFQANGKICPIDFDDCGLGFHMYDLAVTLTSLEHGIDKDFLTKKEYRVLEDTFLERYDDQSNLTSLDLEALETLKLARRFFGTQWLNLRVDNPVLKKRSIPYAKETVRIAKKELSL